VRRLGQRVAGRGGEMRKRKEKEARGMNMTARHRPREAEVQGRVVSGSLRDVRVEKQAGGRTADNDDRH